MKRISNKSLGAALLSLVIILTACSNSNADAVQVLETENTSLKATLAAYSSYGPTMTAQVTLAAAKVGTLQYNLTIAQDQIKSLTNRLNAPVRTAPPSVQDAGNTAADGGTTGNSGTTGTTGNTSSDGTGGQSGTGGTDTSSTSASFAGVVTAKNIISATGCADTTATTFAATDAKIFVVADARNFKSGTTFTAQWSGGNNFTRQDTWTAPNGSAKLCIYFYIQPTVLALAAGSYSVTMSADGLGSSSAQFTVQ